MSSTCPICLDKSRIPVEIQCFPCFNADIIHCHSLIRYCEQCCIKLFELEKHPQDRKSYLKCLYCDASTDPRKFHGSHLPYRKDFYAIAQDTSIMEECPYCDHILQGVHNNHQGLGLHLSRDCPSAYSFCNDCHCAYQRSESHDEDCIRHYVICTECGKRVSTTLEDHMENECMYRLIRCKYCPGALEALHYADHLVNHIESSKRRTILLTELLDQEKKLCHQMLHECNRLFCEMYVDEGNEHEVSYEYG